MLPLPCDVAELLRVCLVGKPAGVPVWGGKWATQLSASRMLRRDLKAAGIPYCVEGPDGPEYADFHALRHTMITRTMDSGMKVHHAQALARHANIKQTLKYTHARRAEVAQSLQGVPSLPSHRHSTRRRRCPERTVVRGQVARRCRCDPTATGTIRNHRSA